MKKLFLQTIMATCFATYANSQSIDLFSYTNGYIQPKASMISKDTNDEQSVSQKAKVYSYSTKLEKFSDSGQAGINLSMVGTFQASQEELVKNFFYDGFYIHDLNGKLLLEKWGYDSFRNVSTLTTNSSDVRPYIHIPLDNDSFALLFGGAIYDGSDIAPEMLIVVVNKNEAKVVFDRPALAYSYTAPPNFSIEFVEEMDWIQNEFGNDDTPTANPLSSRTKYRIWREENMLKYKSWK